LIKKHRGDFCLTLFGATVYEIIEELRLLSDRYWILKATRPQINFTTNLLKENLEHAIVNEDRISVSSSKKLVAPHIA
jgi:hypothetical protein